MMRFEHLKDLEGRDIFIGNTIEIPMWDSDDNCSYAFRYKVISQESLKFLGSEFQDTKPVATQVKVSSVLGDIKDHPHYPDVAVRVLCPFDCSDCELQPEECGKCHECGRQWAEVVFSKGLA